MKRKFSLVSWIVMLVATVVTVILAASVFAQPSDPGRQAPDGNPPQPPQEAITACQGKAQNAACKIDTPQGTIQGTCMMLGEQLVCAPEGGPPQGQGSDGSGGPPPR